MNSEDGGIYKGIVGWDTGEHYDLGTGENDGHTLVHVQLFDGRDPTKTSVAGEAHGRKLICHLAGGLYYIPTKGTPCIVAIPAGMGDQPGGPVLIATIEKSPVTKFESDQVILDFGPDKHLTVRAKSVSIDDCSTPVKYLVVGAPKVPIMAQPVIWGPTGVAGAASTSVFVSQ